MKIPCLFVFIAFSFLHLSAGLFESDHLPKTIEGRMVKTPSSDLPFIQPAHLTVNENTLFTLTCNTSHVRGYIPELAWFYWYDGKGEIVHLSILHKWKTYSSHPGEHQYTCAVGYDGRKSKPVNVTGNRPHRHYVHFVYGFPILIFIPGGTYAWIQIQKKK